MPRVLTAWPLCRAAAAGTCPAAPGTPAGRSAPRRDLLFEALGHERLGRGDELVDLLAQHGVLLAFDVEQLDGRLRFGGQQAGEHLARIVATVYTRKLPSTLRLGSRILSSSSSLGCTAMPVRSGPMRVPSPPCTWHLAHCLMNTALPRAASPGLLVSGSNSSSTCRRSALGSRRPGPASSRRGASHCGCRDVRPALAVRSSDRSPSSAVPARAPPAGPGPRGRGQQRRDANLRLARASAPAADRPAACRRRRPGFAPRPPAAPSPDRATCAASSGRAARRPLRPVGARRASSSRAAAIRLVSGATVRHAFARSATWPVRAAYRLEAARFPSARPAAPSVPRPARRQPRRTIARARLRSRGRAADGLSAGQPPSQPSTMASATPVHRAATAATSPGDRIVGPRAGAMLGHDPGGLEQFGLAFRGFVDRWNGQADEKCLAVVAAAAISASSIQRSRARSVFASFLASTSTALRRSRGAIGQGQQRGQPHLRIGVVEQSGVEDRPSRRFARARQAPARHCAARRPTDASAPRMAAAVASACEPSKRPSPCKVHRAWIAPTFSPIASTVLILDQFHQRRHDVRWPRSTSSRWAWRRQNRLRVGERADQLLGRGAGQGECGSAGARRPARRRPRDRCGRAACRASRFRRRPLCRS